MYNVFEKQKNMEVRNAQIVYLREVLHMEYKDIVKYVDLAVSTVRIYCRKFAGLLEKAKEWFGEAAKATYAKVKEKLTSLDTVVTCEDCEPKTGDCAYIIEYFNSQKEFIFLKVGMTNNITRRVKEHLRDYTKKGFDATYAVIKKLYYAEDEEDALTLENCLRKHYKAIENCGFIKRDRFSFVRYSNEELNSDNRLQDNIKRFALI